MATFDELRSRAKTNWLLGMPRLENITDIIAIFGDLNGEEKALEDELDRQELRNYIRILGVEPGTIRLESVNGEATQRDRVFYATLFVEVLIMLAVVYFTAATLMKPVLTNMDLAACAMLIAVFGILGYRIFRDTRITK